MKDEYYRICQHCEAVGSMGYGYHKCLNCGKWTISIVLRSEDEEERRD